MKAALLILSACIRPTVVPVAAIIPPPLVAPSDCMVALGPPPVPPLIVADLPRCRNVDGTAMLPDELCLNRQQAESLGSWAGAVYLWSVRAHSACSLVEPEDLVER